MLEHSNKIILLFFTSGGQFLVFLRNDDTNGGKLPEGPAQVIRNA